MLSAEQIKTARRIAHERQSLHEHNDDPDYQIADDISGEEAHFRGLLGEFELSNVFGTQVDLEQRRDGDEGHDAYLLLNEGRFRVDVKVSTYTGPDPYLRVPQNNKLQPRIIYIAGRLDLHTSQVELVGWEWGMIMATCPLQSFSSSGVLNRVKLYRELRKLDELKQRQRPGPGFVGFLRGHFEHYCHCGKEAGFGYGVSLMRDQLGTWYCAEHRPELHQNIPEIVPAPTPAPPQTPPPQADKNGQLSLL